MSSQWTCGAPLRYISPCTARRKRRQRCASLPLWAETMSAFSIFPGKPRFFPLPPCWAGWMTTSPTIPAPCTLPGRSIPRSRRCSAPRCRRWALRRAGSRAACWKRTCPAVPAGCTGTKPARRGILTV